MLNTIILIDRDGPDHDSLISVLKEDYTVTEAGNTKEAIELIRHNIEHTAAILMDHFITRSDDYQLLKTIGQYNLHGRFPVLILCRDNTIPLEDELFQHGIAECLHAPFDPRLIRLRLKNVIRLYQYQSTMHKQHKLLKLQSDRLSKNNETLIDVLGDIVEYRNVESGEHILRVKQYTNILANETMKRFPEFELTPERVAIITAASPLHDIGKIALPDNILMKPGRLTEQEYEYIKSHTISGCEILDNIDGIWSEEYSRVSKEICRSHHERYDGSGYPDGLRGNEIPLSAQIVSIADVYDALTNERVYKDAIPKDHAFRMIINGECGVFSPMLMECLRNVRTEFENV